MRARGCHFATPAGKEGNSILDFMNLEATACLPWQSLRGAATKLRWKSWTQAAVCMLNTSGHRGCVGICVF